MSNSGQFKQDNKSKNMEFSGENIKQLVKKIIEADAEGTFDKLLGYFTARIVSGDMSPEEKKNHSNKPV